MLSLNLQSRIRGICPLAAVPFQEDGSVDYAQFDRLIRSFLKTGVNGIGLFGVVSEFYKLTDVEKTELAHRMLKQMEGSDVYSLISVTDHATEIAVQRAREFQEMGAKCLMVLPPHFMNPSADQLVQHLEAVAEAVTIPLIIQYAPNETGVSISPEVLVQIAQKYPHVLYKIECTDPAAYSKQLLAMKPDLSIMNGYWGIHLLDLLHIGGVGVMPGFSCCELYVEIYRRYHAQDYAGARALHSRLAAYFLRWNTGIERVIAMEKEILRRRGVLEMACCRHPGYTLTQNDFAEIDAFLKEFRSDLPPMSW